MVDLDAIRARCDELRDYWTMPPQLQGLLKDAYALLDEVERLREALKGAQVIANQAGQIIRDTRRIPDAKED